MFRLVKTNQGEMHLNISFVTSDLSNFWQSMSKVGSGDQLQVHPAIPEVPPVSSKNTLSPEDAGLNGQEDPQEVDGLPHDGSL